MSVPNKPRDPFFNADQILELMMSCAVSEAAKPRFEVISDELNRLVEPLQSQCQTSAEAIHKLGAEVRSLKEENERLRAEKKILEVNCRNKKLELTNTILQRDTARAVAVTLEYKLSELRKEIDQAPVVTWDEEIAAWSEAEEVMDPGPKARLVRIRPVGEGEEK